MFFTLLFELVICTGRKGSARSRGHRGSKRRARAQGSEGEQVVDNNDALANIEYFTSSPCKFSLHDVSISNYFSRGLPDLLEQAHLDQKGSQEREYVQYRLLLL